MALTLYLSSAQAARGVFQQYMAAQRRKIMVNYISKQYPPIRSQRLEARALGTPGPREARETGAAREDAEKEGLDARAA